MEAGLPEKTETTWGREQVALAALAGADFAILLTLASRDSVTFLLLVSGISVGVSFPVVLGELLVHYMELEFGREIQSGFHDFVLGTAVLLSLVGLIAALGHASIWIAGAGVIGIIGAGARVFRAGTNLLSDTERPRR